MSIISITTNGAEAPLIQKQKAGNNSHITPLIEKVFQSDNELQSNNNQSSESMDVIKDLGGSVRKKGDFLIEMKELSSRPKGPVVPPLVQAGLTITAIGTAAVGTYAYCNSSSANSGTDPNSNTAMSDRNSFDLSSRPSTLANNKHSTSYEYGRDFDYEYASDLAYASHKPSSDVNVEDHNPTESSLSTSTPKEISLNKEGGGSLHDSFGNHGLHHDGERTAERHGRRHLSDILYAIPVISHIKGFSDSLGYISDSADRSYKPSSEVNIEANNTTESSLSTSTPKSLSLNTDGGGLPDSVGNQGLQHDGEITFAMRGRGQISETAKEILPTSSDIKKHKKLLRRIVRILSQKGFIGRNETGQAEVLSALASYLYDPVTNEFKPKALEQISRIIINTNKKRYGGTEYESISSKQQEYIVRQFFVRTVLGMPFEEYIANKMETSDKPFVLGDLENYLTLPFPDKKLINLDKIPERYRSAFDLLWQSTVEKIMPIINVTSYHENFSSIKLESFEFANYYTGVKFLKQISAVNITKEQAIETGKRLWEYVSEKGFSEFPIDFFLAPALFAISLPAARSDLEVRDNRIKAVDYYLTLRSIHEERQKKYENAIKEYSKALESFRTKSEIVDEEIEKCGKNLRMPDRVLNEFNFADGSEERLQKAKGPAKQAALNGFSKPCDSTEDDIENLFIKALKKLSGAYTNLDVLRIEDARIDLKDEELAYIISPKAIFTLVEPRPLQEHIPPIHPDYNNRYEKLKDKFKRTDLFVVQVENERRLYAMRLDKSEQFYTIHRLDQTAQQKKNWLGVLSENTVTSYSAPKEWDVEEFTLENPTTIKNSDEGITSLIEGLREKHYIKYYNELEEATNAFADIEKIEDIALSITPFVNCFRGSLADRISSCLVDTITTGLFVGQIGKIAVKFGTATAIAFFRSLSVSLARKEATLLVKTFMGAGLKELKNTLKLFGVATASYLDPGFEPVAKVTSIGLKAIRPRLAKIFDSSNIVKAVDSTLNKKHPPKFIKSVKLKLQDEEIKAKVVGKLEKRENVYAQFDPETGECFGEKFIINKQNKISYEFGDEINLNIIDNQVKGLRNIGILSFNSELRGQLIPHRSGFYTTFDHAGEITGKLYLKKEENIIPVTELTKDKYYMIEDGANREVIMKSQETGELEVVESMPKESSEINKYLDKFCSPVSRSKRQVNGAASCEIEDQHLSYTIDVLLPGDEKSLKYNVKYYGLLEMDQEARLSAIDKINNALFFEFDNIKLSQTPIDIPSYESKFAGRNVKIRKIDRKFKDSSDVNIDNNPNKLTKNEKIALRRWTHVPDSDMDDTFKDGMIDFDTAGFSDSGYDINIKLRKGAALNEDERNFVRIFDSALGKLPNQEGSYLRLAKYPTSDTPWENNYKVGDILSNDHDYMSVSSKKSFLSAVESGGGASVAYLFEDTVSSVPFKKGLACLSDESENLFKKGIPFLLKQYAIAEGVANQEGLGYIPKRIASILNEIPRPVDGKVKNIFTGKESEI